MAKIRIIPNKAAAGIRMNAGAIQGAVIDAGLSQLRKGILRATLAPFRTNFNREEYKSYLNTPVFGSFIFGDISQVVHRGEGGSGNNYVDQFGETKSFTPLRFHECTYQVSQSKNIVTTVLQGFNGTVKEYVSDGDFHISIDGRLSGVYDPISDSFRSGSHYPTEYVQDLVAALKVPAAIPISNIILSGIFGINFVVVTDFAFQRNTAGMNYQRFTLDLISDRPIEIVLSEADLENNQKISDLLGT